MAGPLRVLALAQYPETAPSTRFRLAQFVPALRTSNVALTIHPFLTNEQYRIARHASPLRAMWHLLNGFRDLATTIASSGAYDVVMVQRNLAPIMDRRFLGMLRRKGIPLVYDFDDAVFLELVGGRRWLELLRSPRETTTEFCRSAAVVLAGNDHLADFARHAAGRNRSDRVRVLPSVVDTDRFAPASTDEERLPTLGWVGSDTTVRYLESLAPALLRLRRRTPYRLVVIAGDTRPRLAGLDYDFVPWSSETEVEVFHQLDVGLYPLEDTPWSRGKCGFKAIQYLACGVPCVASPVGPLKDIVTPGETGFHAREESEWVEHCRTLLTDRDMRLRFGRAGRDAVVERYSVRWAAPLLSASLHEAVRADPLANMATRARTGGS